jgi:7,8-dihydropterin-6-yl-methyl-4-(beta-D-ribofuranosyl)aminobenzene 5'-phosphate synthase
MTTRSIFIFVIMISLLLKSLSLAGGNKEMIDQKNKPVKNRIELTVVFDNYGYKEGLETYWGFACVIRGLEETILFDTGANGDILLRNMQALGIDPKEIDTVFLSHFHWDHTGGLDKFLSRNSRVKVYLLKSFPQEIKDIVSSHQAKLIEIHESQQICKNTITTGEMGTQIREQSLVVQSPKGLIVITGCAHPGIVEIVKKAKDLLQQDVYLVMGGFHLKDKTEKEIKGILSDFRKMTVLSAGPSHCTGDLARNLFKQEYQQSYVDVGVGKVINIE